MMWDLQKEVEKGGGMKGNHWFIAVSLFFWC